MKINKTFFLLATLFSLPTAVLAQSYSTYSPYSRYGIGEIRSQGYANSRAMGGLSQGIRSGTAINYLNPASYTSQDTMSFIFDFGLEGVGLNSQSGNQSNFNTTGNIHHLAIQFPLAKWMGASAGIQPYSNVGYRIKRNETDLHILSSIGAVKYYNYGSGGVSQAFFGFAVEPLKDLSLGMNMSYMFGSIEYNSEIIFPQYSVYNSIQELNSIVIRDLVYSFGMQYALNFGTDDNFRLVLGATYDMKGSLNAYKVRHIQNMNRAYDTIFFQEKPNSTIDLPSKIAAGFSLSYKNVLMGGFEYSTQDWSNVKILKVPDSLTRSQSFRVGLQFTPNVSDLRSYYKRVSYRCGFRYTQSYINLYDNQINDYGMSFGVGLPYRRTNTSFNISVELGKKGTLDDGLVRETYGIFNIGFTFYDFWFIKRKYN